MAEKQGTLAIVNTGGKQYPVREGDEITIEKLDAEVGATVELATVGAFDEDGALIKDAPAVQGEVVNHFRDKKI
ncbi:MAG: bL21 family ribosomal protein, partial [Gemmatimonadetes bacterium]|nr:bL21 family ribosomal protein [Gemmatimonadota bacterium]